MSAALCSLACVSVTSVRVINPSKQSRKSSRDSRDGTNPGRMKATDWVTPGIAAVAAIATVAAAISFTSRQPAKEEAMSKRR